MTLLHHVNDNKFNADELTGRKGSSGAAWMAATCQHKRVVLASSAAVYGSTPELPAAEDSPLCPQSPYAAEKAFGEALCSMSASLWGLEASALRFFNVYGPRQVAGSNYSGVITAFVTALESERDMLLHGDGEQTRDFVFVGDVVEAIQAALGHRETGVFNIGTGLGTSIRELGTTLAGLGGRVARFERTAARPGDVRHSRACTTRATEALGFTARTELMEGLRKTLLWQREGAA